jgi:hypothetical protein
LQNQTLFLAFYTKSYPATKPPKYKLPSSYFVIMARTAAFFVVALLAIGLASADEMNNKIEKVAAR